MTILTDGIESMASNATRLLLVGYKDSLTDESSKERYLNKIKLINSLDPYEFMKEDWKDDVDRPNTSYICCFHPALIPKKT